MDEKPSFFCTSFRLMISSAVMSNSTFYLLPGRSKFCSILSLSSVYFLLPEYSESLVVFQVFRTTVQSKTNIPAKGAV